MYATHLSQYNVYHMYTFSFHFLKNRLFKLISKLHLHYIILDVCLCAPKDLAITTESKGFSFTIKLPIYLGKVYNYFRGGYSKITKQIAPSCLFYFLHPPTSKDNFFTFSFIKLKYKVGG